MSRTECAGASRRWFHHGGTINGTIRYVPRRGQGVLSWRTSVSISFSSWTDGRDEERENSKQNGEGKSALSMHSHPFDHSSSISGLDLECNSRQEVRGTRLNGWRGKRIKCLELKLKTLGRGNKERLGYSGRKEERKLRKKDAASYTEKGNITRREREKEKEKVYFTT